MKNKQIEKIKTKTFGKIVLIILWTFLIFLVFKGSISILNPNKIGSNDIKIENEKENSRKLIENNAVSFAENFTREYMTFCGDDEEYKNRLSIFTSNSLELENKKIFTSSYVNSIKHKWATDNTVLVDCIVRGSVKNLNTTPNLLLSEEVFYIRTAVKVLDDNFLISRYPTFISAPKEVTLKNEQVLKGDELDDNDKKIQIKKVVESFLKAYYDGQNTEIQYFVEDPKIREGKKPFEFDSTKEILINWNEKNEFYVKISYYVAKNEDKFLQNMEFKLKVKDNKFVITSYNTKL